MIHKSIFYGTLAALTCAIAGGVLIGMANDFLLGYTMFLVLPGVTGFVTAMTSRFWSSVGISLLITLAVCLGGLLFSGLEGLVCVLMAFPILVITAMLGAGIGLAIRDHVTNDSKFSLGIMPLLAGISIFGAGKVENELTTGVRTETVVSSITIDATPEDVWDALLEFDRVEGPKPLLMRCGLPIPESCTTEGTGVGSQRTCHFNSGFVRERVTRWEPGQCLEFDVVDVQLPGRHWLGFQGAKYTLETTDTGQTLVKRTTIVTSTLRPAIYWQFFERLGTETEHEYILKSLRAELE
jgi:hypothetical protein